MRSSRKTSCLTKPKRHFAKTLLSNTTASYGRRHADESLVTDAPFCLIEDSQAPRDLWFAGAEAFITAKTLAEVAPAFLAMQTALAQGRHLAGFFAYECGYAFEPRLAPLLPPGELLRFGVFDAPQQVARIAPEKPAGVENLRADWCFADYAPRFQTCMDYLRAGDIYQVNLTFPLSGRYFGSPLDLYRTLRSRQPVALGGVVALGDEVIVSLSPERFFSTNGRNISVRPMKGTAPRGATPAQDAKLAAQLAADEKSQAENLMIVDLLRNDLSRLSEIGSVKVTDLYTVEAYPTLHQLTSGVEARLRPGVKLAEIFKGLFPCGSVTGAPKIRAMQIIRELETAPRGAYCGAIGHIAPNGDMRFNVAIRSLTLRPNGELTGNVGSAIVADSRAQEEYDECLLKARFLAPLSA
jgi:aminodeoxychorismate synthase component I